MASSILSLLVLFFSMILQVIIPPIPAELIVIAAGAQYGVLTTTLVAGTGLFFGGLIVYFFGTKIHSWFSRFFKKENVGIVIKRIKEFESFILWIRILPYNPSDIISYAAGIMKFNTKKFVTITLITSYSRCFLLAYLGTMIQNVQTFLLVGVILIVSALFAYSIVYKRSKNAKK